MSKPEENQSVEPLCGTAMLGADTVDPKHAGDDGMGARSMTVGRFEEIRRRLSCGSDWQRRSTPRCALSRGTRMEVQHRVPRTCAAARSFSMVRVKARCIHHGRNVHVRGTRPVGRNADVSELEQLTANATMKLDSGHGGMSQLSARIFSNRRRHRQRSPEG
jgi:hypothetical protein